MDLSAVKYFITIMSGLILIVMMTGCAADEEGVLMKRVLLNDDQASVTAVSCTGQPHNYTLQVTIASPDTGCDQYADWWEVLTPDSTLIYRRILTHSHVDEQPFTRSGGIVNVSADEFIYVRAHMNNLSYGSVVFSGTIKDSLRTDTLDPGYALSLELTAPLPSGCAF